MRLRWVFASIVTAALVAGWIWVAYRQNSLANESRDRAQTILALEEQLGAARQEIARQEQVAQRESLRRQTLAGANRSPDEFLALFPARFPQGDWQPAESHFEDCWFRSADGLRLHGWLLVHERPRHVLLLVHGNAGNLTHRAATAQYLSERYSATVFVFDYRGYGRSEGTPTIPGLLDDARAARQLLAQRAGVSEPAIVLLGESLGGAIAVDLAAADGARALVLQSTFSSLKEVAAAHYPAMLVDVLVANRLDSAAKIKQFRGPLLQFHGQADRTIPFALGRKLFDAANQPKTFMALPRHDHNHPLPEQYYQRLDEFMARLGDR